jgi:hypothetical protein
VPLSPTTAPRVKTVEEAKELLTAGRRYFHDDMNLYCVVKLWPSQGFVDIENCWTKDVQERVKITELLGLSPVSP